MGRTSASAAPAVTRMSPSPCCETKPTVFNDKASRRNSSVKSFGVCQPAGSGYSFVNLVSIKKLVVRILLVVHPRLLQFRAMRILILLDLRLPMTKLKFLGPLSHDRDL